MNDYQNGAHSGGGDGADPNGHPSGYYPPQGDWQPGNPYGANSGGAAPHEPEKPYTYNYSDYGGQGDGGKPPKRGKKGLAVFFSIIAVIVVVSLLSFTGYGIYVMATGNNFLYGPGDSPDATAPPQADAPRLDISAPPGVSGSANADSGLTNEQIAAQVSPSVVGITNIQTDPQQGVLMGQGTGIVMSKDGYIVTNEHVVSGATGLQVTLDNGESYNATLVGGDNATDLAVIKLEAEQLPDLTVAKFGDSDQLKLGERVVAIGNAGGTEFAGTVTGGMVSGLNRQIQTDTGSTLTVIQTDAAINPGNSGGPLINKHGQVVGINSAKYTRQNFEGIGFSIPMNSAKPIVDDLIKNGRVTGRAKLGINGIDVGRVNLQAYGVPANIGGVLVVKVDKGSDIARQGVVVMDILTAADGKPIESMSALRSTILEKKPGDKIDFEVYRFSNQTSSKTFKVTVTLSEDDGVAEEEAQQEQQQEQLPQNPWGNGGTLPGWPFWY